MNQNYYLSLLHKKVTELKRALEEIKNGNYSNEYKKYLISGYIITLDSILEIGISDLHSQHFDELTSLIYYTRQKAVHYGYFNGIHNIEETAQKIIDLTEQNYVQEQEYYKNLLDFEVDEAPLNIMINNSHLIEEDAYFYKFKSKDGKKVLLVNTGSVFKLTQKNKTKTANYIIDTSKPFALYTYENDKLGTYCEISGDDVKAFFKENYAVTAENYNEHSIVMQSIIHSFVTDPLNSIQIMEYTSNEQLCKNTIDVIKEFVLEKTMYIGYVENSHLIKDKYSLNKTPKIDYVKLQSNFRKNIFAFINERDVFFIRMTLERYKHYCNLFEEVNDADTFRPEVLSPILIQLFEIGPKHFSNKFIHSSPEFKKCYSNLQRYRQIFSHYILTGKEYKDALEKFKNEFISFIGLLHTIDLSNIKNFSQDEYGTYSLIERDKSDFFNYKHEQYLRVHSGTYIGKKIHYSSHNPKSKSLIAILPGGNNAANILYYQRGLNDYLSPKYTIDEKSGKKCYIHTLNTPLKGTREAKIDFGLTNLFKAHFELSKIKEKGEIQIHFAPCEENGNCAHYDTLDTVILRFYNQGYLPVELLQKTKLNLSKLSKGLILLTDSKGNVIATIINKQKYNLETSNKKDEKRFFSRIDDIEHDFTRRRHTK